MTNFKFFLAGLAMFVAGWLIVSVLMPAPIRPETKAIVEAKERQSREEQFPCIYFDPAESRKF